MMLLAQPQQSAFEFNGLNEIGISQMNSTNGTNKKRKLQFNSTSNAKRRKVEHRTPIERLPEHIICYIFSFLSQPDIVKGTLAVCKRWYSLGRKNYLWRTLDFKGFKVNTMEDVLSFLQNVLIGSKCESIPSQQANFDGVIILPNKCSKMNANNFRNLRRIYPFLSGITLPSGFSEIPSISDASLKQIAQFSNMKQLTIPAHSKITDKGISILSEKMKKLENINLDNCTGLTSLSFRYLLQRCPELKVISIQSSNCALDNEDVALLGKFGKNIRELKVDLKEIDIHIFENFLKNCNKIKKLCIRGYPNISGKSIELICSELKSLEELSIYCDEKAEIETPKFSSLSLKLIQIYKPAAILYPKIYCPNLQKFYLEKCKEFREAEFQCQQLNVLRLRSCNIVSVDISQMLRRMPSLLDFEIFDCRSDGIGELNVSLEKLEKMVLFMLADLKKLRIEKVKSWDVTKWELKDL